jgi:hypothetical protein
LLEEQALLQEATCDASAGLGVVGPLFGSSSAPPTFDVALHLVNVRSEPGSLNLHRNFYLFAASDLLLSQLERVALEVLCDRLLQQSTFLYPLLEDRGKP